MLAFPDSISYGIQQQYTPFIITLKLVAFSSCENLIPLSISARCTDEKWAKARSVFVCDDKPIHADLTNANTSHKWFLFVFDHPVAKRRHHYCHAMYLWIHILVLDFAVFKSHLLLLLLLLLPPTFIAFILVHNENFAPIYDYVPCYSYLMHQSFEIKENIKATPSNRIIIYGAQRVCFCLPVLDDGIQILIANKKWKNISQKNVKLHNIHEILLVSL